MNCVKLYFFFFVFVGFLSLRRIHGDLISDKQALLDFAAKLPHYRSLNWDENSPICDHWIGITCNDEQSGVIAVRLPAVGFDGPIPPQTIGRLSELQILSLRSNNINGEFPSDLANLKNLSFLYLQSNNFSGQLPADFSVWKNLTVVNLSGNKFNGSIPLSLQNSTNLVSLNLANNSLSGPIPDFRIPGLQQLDFSNNHLAGIVPEFLRSRFPDSAFKGNGNVTFPKLPPPPPSQPPPQTAKSKLGEAALLGIIVAGGILALITIGFLLLICCSKIRRKNGTGTTMMSSSSLEKGARKMKMMSSPEKREAGANRLAFFEGGCGQAFDLEDLLRASAEVLGKGTFGTAYKAALEDGTVVVKRLKDVGVGKRDFEQQMEIVGAIRDENVVELRAYYYSKDEKLMLYDFYPDGSLSALLHGRRREDRVPLDWETRLRIALGAARGIARIHTENNNKLVHGNVKSTNIFINPSSGSGCVSDTGLAAIMSPLAHPVSRAAGYRAPEVSDTRKAGQPSDVYSFGVVLLELLTGKSPIHTTAGDEMVHLVRWVHSVVREEWTDEVFDIELMRYANIEEEMVETLQIAMSCVVRRPDQRPKMSDVANMIENVRRPKRLVSPPGQGMN